MMKLSTKKRKIGYTYGSVSGVFSFRGDKGIPFESLLEKDLLSILDFNDSVSDVISQPFTLEYIDRNGKNRRYTPDFLVYFRALPSEGMSTLSQKPLLIEVKPNEKLKKHWPEFRERYKMAARYAQENDFIFKIYDENRIRGNDLRNIELLNRYKNLVYDINEEERILEHLKVVGHTAIDHLLAYLYVTEVQLGIGLGHVWNLIGRKKIGCDIGQPLTRLSTIWLNVDESYEEGILNAIA
jgi:hypothetical protein